MYLITEGRFRKTGIKSTDITPEFDALINSASDFIIACGYNFTPITNRKSILQKILHSKALIKHCIMPISLVRGTDVNRGKALELVRRGVSVSVEERNHSKWLMTEKGIYYGSANMSIDSIEKKIEVVSFMDFYQNDPLRKEFARFVLDSMKRMLTTSSRRQVHGVITRNDQLVRNARSLVKRYNPSIKKVEETITDIYEVRSSLMQVLDNSFWFLQDNLYRELTFEVDRLLRIINGIIRFGNEVLTTKRSDSSLDVKISRYNRYCDMFMDKIPSLPDHANGFILNSPHIPFFATRNRKLCRTGIEMLNGFD